MENKLVEKRLEDLENGVYGGEDDVGDVDILYEKLEALTIRLNEVIEHLQRNGGSHLQKIPEE